MVRRALLFLAFVACLFLLPPLLALAAGPVIEVSAPMRDGSALLIALLSVLGWAISRRRARAARRSASPRAPGPQSPPAR